MLIGIFYSQIVESSSLVSVLFRGVLSHPYISFFHLLVINIYVISMRQLTVLCIYMRVMLRELKISNQSVLYASIESILIISMYYKVNIVMLESTQVFLLLQEI